MSTFDMHWCMACLLLLIIMPCFVTLGEFICKVCLSVLFRYLRTHEEFHLVFKRARVFIK